MSQDLCSVSGVAVAFTLVLTAVACAGDIGFAKDVKVGGDLAERLALTEKRLAASPYTVEFTVEDVARVPGKERRFEEYEGDVSGRVLGAWSYLARTVGTRPGKLAALAEEILKYQKTEGYFGVDQRPLGWDKWGRQNFGHGRLLIGLVEYYRLSGDKRYLESARRLGDFFVATIPQWTTAWPENPYVTTKVARPADGITRERFIHTHQTSVMEALVMLSEACGDKTYLAAARALLPLVPEFGRWHSHSYCSTLAGLVMLARATGDDAPLKRVCRLYWEGIMRHGWRTDGSVPEYYPIDARTEGCSLTDWLRLNIQLWRSTRDTRYLDEAERTWLNGLNYHQTTEGAFGHACFTATGYSGNAAQAWWCCLMHGLVAHTEVANYAVVADADRLYVNFLTPLSGAVAVAGGQVRFELQTGYPSTGEARLTLQADQERTFDVSVRTPRWALNPAVTVNGEPQAAAARDGAVTLRRAWRSGDVVGVTFPVGLRLEDGRGNDLLTLSSFGKEPVAGYLFHGPLLLGADTQRNLALPDTLRLTLANMQHNYRLPDAPGLFTVKGAHYRLPSETDGQAGEAVLVPISEFTGYGEWAAELSGFERNGEKPTTRPEVRTCQALRITPK
jgi:rhamnogalacturonyl hydrolase YesR